MSKFLYDHKVVSVLTIVWMMGLVTWVTWRVFGAPPDIPTATAAAYATVFGLPALAIGLWKWRNGGEHHADSD